MDAVLITFSVVEHSAPSTIDAVIIPKVAIYSYMATTRERDKQGRFVKKGEHQERGISLGPQNYTGGAWFHSGLKPSHSGILVDEIAALNLSAIWRGVKVLAGDVTKLPLNVYQHLPNGGKKVIRDNPVFELLCYPNQYQGGKVFRSTIMVHLVLWGNAYVEILRDPDGLPIRLELLDPRKVVPKREDDYRLFYDLNGHSPFSGKKILLPENILHFKGLSVSGDVGISPIGVSAETLGTALALDRYSGTLFGNGAVPQGVIQCPPGWPEDARVNFRQAWMDEMGGVDNANKVAVLEEGAKWVATSFNPEQLQMLSAKQFSVQEVGRILGLPPSKLGDYSHEANRSLEEQNRDYFQTSLEPYTDTIEEEIGLKLFTFQDRRKLIFVEHDMSKLTRASDLDRASTFDIMMRNGIVTRNEWRSDFGYNPFEEDLAIAPMNMEEVSSDVDLDPNPNELDPIDSPQPTEPEPLGEIEDQARAVLLEATKRMVTRELKNLVKANKRGELDQAWCEDYYEGHSKILKEAVSPALRLYGLATRSKRDPDRFLDLMVRESKEAILGTQDREGLLDSWEDTRAEDYLTRFKEGE